MSTPVSNIPISIDYTSKDYYALREELIARIQSRIPEWTASDPADFGVALVEAFAYLGDLINYYIDRNANESLITTATQRRSVLNIAQNYGYIPAGYRQSFVDLTFINNSEDPQVIPAGTVVSGDVVIGDTVQTVYFTTNTEFTVQEQIDDVPGEQVIIGYNGRSIELISDDVNEYGEKIGVSAGVPNMTFELLETPVVDGSIELYVQDGDVYSKWTQVQHILDYGPTDLVFNVYLDENDIVYINFGDGVSGVIPTKYSEIRAKYIVGGGVIGNITAGIIDTASGNGAIEYVPGLSESQTTALQSVIDVKNLSVGIGGSDPETTDEIRSNASIALRANNRAVTLQDYAFLAVAVPGVGKANATASVWTSVTLYIAPSRAATDPDLAPGYNDDEVTPSIEYDRIKSGTENYLSDKILLGTTVTIQPPEYVDLYIEVEYTKLPQYTTAEIETGIKAKLLSDFGYNGMNFEDTIYPQDIEFSLSQIPGIKVIKVTILKKDILSISSASGTGTIQTYTLNTNPSMSVGSVVSITGLSPSGYNVTNAPVVAVGSDTISVAGATTGTSSGTGAITGLFYLKGTAGEIFRFKEENIDVTEM